MLHFYASAQEEEQVRPKNIRNDRHPRVYPGVIVNEKP